MPSLKKEEKKPIPFRLSESAKSMLKYISDKDGRSQAKEIESLIRKRYVELKDIENTGGIIL